MIRRDLSGTAQGQSCIDRGRLAQGLLGEPDAQVVLD
jgi:hypothetical protein